MIQVAYIELPSEQRYKIKVDEQDTGFHFARDEEKEGRFVITNPDDRPLKRRPRSREGAALFAAFMHFELERADLDAQQGDGGS